MSGIDWSKAPEGATHWMQESHDWLEGFWKRAGAANYFYEKGEWVFSGGKPFGHPKLIARPSPAWSGDVLPPVGTKLECRFACQEGVWHLGECVAVGQNPEQTEEICVVASGGRIANYRAESGWLRPIRTQAQIEADEREAAIIAACESVEEKISKYNTRLDCSVAIRATVEAIYDAGYRKQPTKQDGE